MNLDLSKSKIFLICCIAFILGVAISSYRPEIVIDHDLIWFIAVVVVFSIVVLFWSKRKIRIIALGGLFLLIGIWRSSLGLPAKSPDKIFYYNNQQARVLGLIDKEPDIKETDVKLEISSEMIEIRKKFYKISGKILVTANLYPEYHYGDELEILCNLQSPKEFNDFAYDKYLARYDIYSLCYFPKVKVIKTNQGNIIYTKIFEIKNVMRQIIDLGLSEPAAGLARGILMGDQKALDNDLSVKFQHLGLSHIVAISGMNISILSAVFMAALIGLGLHRRWAFYFSCILLILFVILVGAPASAVRAGFMGFLILWALHLGRLNKITNSLVLTAAIMLAINPMLFLFDIGFQLSFLALIGIIYIYPILNEYSEKIRWSRVPSFLGFLGRGAMGALLVTISAQVFTLPIMAYNFGMISLFAPMANLLILWTQAPLMVLGLAAIGLSFLLSGASILFFLPVRALLWYIIKTVEFLDRFPYTYIVVDIKYAWLNWLWLGAYYVIVFWIVFKKQSSSFNGPSCAFGYGGRERGN